MEDSMQAQTQKFVDMLLPATKLKGRKLDKFLASLEKEYIEKKVKWVGEHKDETRKLDTETLADWMIRVFYKQHLQVPEKNINPERDYKRLIARPDNECPISNACTLLGLDTRIICKKVFHEPYQALLSAIDSRLHFNRDYQNIKPYTPYCEEIITFE